MISQSTLYQIAHGITPCCAAPAVVSQPSVGLPDCFCAGCLTDLQVGYVSHVQRMVVWREWPWVDVKGGMARVGAMQADAEAHAAQLFNEAMERAAPAILGGLREIFAECDSVQPDAPLLDLTPTWRAAAEVGDALAAAVYLVALRVAVVVGRFA